jgi:hypothetical protein
MKKKALLVQLDDIDRKKLEALASKWGVSLSGAIRRLIREFDNS